MQNISRKTVLSIIVAALLMGSLSLLATETKILSDDEWDTLWNSRIVKYSKFQMFAMWGFEKSGKRVIEKYVPLIITKTGVFVTNWISEEKQWETFVIHWTEIKEIRHFSRKENKIRLKGFQSILKTFDGNPFKTHFRPKTESVELELENGNSIRFTPKQYNQKIKFLFDDLMKFSAMYSNSDENP